MSDQYVMGLCYSHDASVCILKNGVPLVGIQKERITRKKHDGFIHNINLDESIQYCLDYAQIGIQEISVFIENSPTIMYCKEKDNVLGFNRKRMLDDVDQNKIIQISHHIAHAFGAYWSSPFEESAILIIDGQGNYFEDITEDLSWATIFPTGKESSFIERESIYEFTNTDQKVLRKNLSTIHKSFTKICWIWHMYETVSWYLFKSRHDAGKLMWLAPYGKERYNFNIIDILSSGELDYNTDRVGDFTNPNRSKNWLKDNWDDYCDLAYKTQKELEKWIMSLVSWTRKNSTQENLSYSGGVALNCTCNNLIKFDGWFKNVYITPAASDAGISLGCAYYGYLKYIKWAKKIVEYSDYLGKTYTDKDILDSLDTYKNKIIFKRSDNIFLDTAKLIQADNVIWWYQGRSEFWPRALWNRSIVANPGSKKMKEILNDKIKFREPFRPFAPSVLEEYSKDFFDIEKSPYMLITAKVHEEKKNIIPAVTHVDGTSRIQTVNKVQNERYYNLIKEFYWLTGIPLVVNTSFNIKDEPIVETPKDAIRCFLGTGIDCLVIGDYIITKQ